MQVPRIVFRILDLLNLYLSFVLVGIFVAFFTAFTFLLDSAVLILNIALASLLACAVITIFGLGLHFIQEILNRQWRTQVEKAAQNDLKKDLKNARTKKVAVGEYKMEKCTHYTSVDELTQEDIDDRFKEYLARSKKQNPR